MGAAYADYGAVARPGSLPAARLVALYLPAALVAALALFGFVLLLTSTGSLPSFRWRWWAWVTAAAPVVMMAAITVAPGHFDRPYQATANPLDLSGVGGALLGVYQVAFAARLRDQVDLTSLSGELLAVVDQTVQPTHASLWLRREAPQPGTSGRLSR